MSRLDDVNKEIDELEKVLNPLVYTDEELTPEQEVKKERLQEQYIELVMEWRQLWIAKFNKHNIKESEKQSKLSIGRHVIIKKYIGDQYNERGVVQGHCIETNKWWVSNMNQPYMGTVSGWFAEDELEIIK